METQTIERHERVRADWLLHHKGSGSALSDQRMSNQLRNAAAQKGRAAAGAAESAHHEAQIKPLVSRWVSGGEDQTDRGGRSFWVVALSVPALLTAGPMLAVSKGLYHASTEVILRRTKDKVQQIPKALPWLAVSLAAAVVAALLTTLLPVKIIQPWPWKVSYEPVNLLIVYMMWQLVCGTMLTAWQVRRHGWLGVRVKALSDTKGLLPTGPEAGYMPQTDEKPSTAPEPVASAVLDASARTVELAGFDDIEFEDWMTDEQDETNPNEGSKDNV